MYLSKYTPSSSYAMKTDSSILSLYKPDYYKNILGRQIAHSAGQVCGTPFNTDPVHEVNGRAFGTDPQLPFPYSEDDKEKSCSSCSGASKAGGCSSCSGITKAGGCSSCSGASKGGGCSSCSGIAKGETCSFCHNGSGLFPLLKPEFNIREISKQLILLEDHVNQRGRRCQDCIFKHTMFCEGLIEEAITLDESGTYTKMLEQLLLDFKHILLPLVKKVKSNTVKDEDYFLVARKLRKIRKPLCIMSIDFC